MNINILNWEELEWTNVRDKIRRKVFTGKGATVTYGEIIPGNVPGPHKHLYEQIVLITKGECDFYVGGVAYPLKAGSIMSVPPNVEHYIVAKGDIPVINLDIFIPRRPEYQQSKKITK